MNNNNKKEHYQQQMLVRMKEPSYTAGGNVS
jgi:hypothetical protein